MPHYRNPFWEIQGMLTTEDGEELWHPLFQYESQVVAEAMFKHIFDCDTFPKGTGIDEYEDFRLKKPDPALTEEERAARRRKKAARDARMAERAQADQDAASGRTAGRKRRRRTA